MTYHEWVKQASESRLGNTVSYILSDWCLERDKLIQSINETYDQSLANKLEALEWKSVADALRTGQLTKRNTPQAE